MPAKLRVSVQNSHEPKHKINVSGRLDHAMVEEIDAWQQHQWVGK